MPSDNDQKQKTSARWSLLKSQLESASDSWTQLESQKPRQLPLDQNEEERRKLLINLQQQLQELS